MIKTFYCLSFIVIVLIFAPSCSTVPPKVMLQEKLIADADSAGLTLPPGFGACKVAENLGSTRHIAVTSQGLIYLKIMGKVAEGKAILRLKDTNGDGKSDEVAGLG
ncbi:MAG: sorbosone dehydrogenase, partial [Bacteroidota bacterium]